MRLIVEGYPYAAQDVERVLLGIDAPQSKDGLVRVNCVGYFNSRRLNDCVIFLPNEVFDQGGGAEKINLRSWLVCAIFASS